MQECGIGNSEFGMAESHVLRWQTCGGFLPFFLGWWDRCGAIRPRIANPFRIPPSAFPIPAFKPHGSGDRQPPPNLDPFAVA